MSTQTLDVYFNTQKIGQLCQTGNHQLNFNYLPAWLATPNAIPISLSLPLQAETFFHAKTRAFFANLLPEGHLRTRISRMLGTSEANDFGLLASLAGETAGAISLRSPEGMYQETTKLPLNHVELKNLPGNLAKQPFFAGNQHIRLTLSGAQNKLPVWIEQGQIYLPTNFATSNYILKPALTEFPSSVENEWFCMKLARALDLPVPTVNMLRDPAIYIVKRYDRMEQSGQQIKLHQEDFCQAMGILPEHKYETAGGPSLAQCFDLLRKNSSSPARDLQLLLQWMIFNFFIGNSDGHAKNIALLLSENGLQLAPFYDLMSTAVYPELTSNLAMNIGDEVNPEKICLQHWHAFARDVGIKPSLVEKWLRSIASRIINKANELANKMPKNSIINEIIELMQQRINNQKLHQA